MPRQTGMCRMTQARIAAVVAGLCATGSAVMATAGFCWHLNPGTTVCMVGMPLP